MTGAAVFAPENSDECGGEAKVNFIARTGIRVLAATTLQRRTCACVPRIVGTIFTEPVWGPLGALERLHLTEGDGPLGVRVLLSKVG